MVSMKVREITAPTMHIEPPSRFGGVVEDDAYWTAQEQGFIQSERDYDSRHLGVTRYS
jgi:hypothetical protein